MKIFLYSLASLIFVSSCKNKVQNRAIYEKKILFFIPNNYTETINSNLNAMDASNLLSWVEYNDSSNGSRVNIFVKPVNGLYNYPFLQKEPNYWDTLINLKTYKVVIHKEYFINRNNNENYFDIHSFILDKKYKIELDISGKTLKEKNLDSLFYGLINSIECN